MSERLTITDDDIRAAFVRRAARAREEDLLRSIVSRTAATRQQRRWWRALDWSVVGRTLALAVVGALLIGLALFAGGNNNPLPETTESPQATAASPPATASSPPAASASPSSSPRRQRAGLFRLPFDYLLPVGTQLERYWPDAYAYRFGDGAPWVTVGWATDAVVHACPNGSEPRGVALSDEPRAFLSELDSAGVGLGPAQPTTLSGRPALTADVEGVRCDFPADMHLRGGLGGGQLTFDRPSRLIVASVGGELIVVQVAAETEESLAASMPLADEFISSIEFSDAP